MKDRSPLGSLFAGVALAALAALACASTPDKRIEANQALFDTYPPDVQANIRQGKVELGYDIEMVRMALGDPDEVSTDTDDTGETLMWGYTRSRPGFSVGLGGGGYGGGAGMGGGVGMGSGPRRDYEAIIEFRDGKVTKVRNFDNG